MGIGEEFIRKTRYGDPGTTDQMRGIPAPELEPEFSGTIHSLPDPDTGTISRIDLSAAIESRESIRRYSDKPLTLAEVSYLLWCTQGVKWIFDDVTFRTVPSSGARHAIDTYLLVNRVEGLKPGLYRFLALEHALGTILEDEYTSELIERACFDQKFISGSAACFIWVADIYRMTWRYGERGFRDIFLDAGHVCQNLYLSAQAVDSGVCAIGAFRDEEINDLLDLDGEKKFVIYLAAVGKNPEEDSED
ncbi:MAG: SagB/ThcOx family dehydrogenase [Methanospirillum sp.]|nr:SagB/ThcOx family dehydrogenase [Methanospirillum sp.]